MLLVLPAADSLSLLVFESGDYGRFIRIVSITLVIELFSEVCLTYIRIQERSLLFTTVSLCKLLLALSLNIYFLLYLDMGISGILFSGLITGAVTLFVVMGLAWQNIRFSFCSEILWQMLAYSAPLIFNWFSMFLLNFGDRFLLQRLASFSDLGLYALAYKFGMLPNFLVCAPFMRYWSVKRFELMKDPSARSTYSRVFSYFCLAELYICLGIAVLIPEVLPFISEESFHQAAAFVPILLLAYLFNGVYLQLAVGLLVKKYTRQLATCSLATAGCNLLLNAFLIPRFGAWGAAIATLLSFVGLSAFVYWQSQKVFPIVYQWGKVFGLSFVAFLIYALASMLSFETTLGALCWKFSLAASYPLWILPLLESEERELVWTTVQRLLSSLSRRMNLS